MALRAARAEPLSLEQESRIVTVQFGIEPFYFQDLGNETAAVPPLDVNHQVHQVSNLSLNGLVWDVYGGAEGECRKPG